MMKDRSRKLVEFINRSWFVTVLLSTLPVAYFTLIQICGKQFSWVNEQGDLKKIPFIIFVIAMIVFVMFEIFRIFAQTSFIQSLIDGNKSLKGVVVSGREIDKIKKKRIVEHIDKASKNGKMKNPIWTIAKPIDHIDDIIKEMNYCLSELTACDRSEIGISVIYQDVKTGKWLSKQHNADGNAEKIINDPLSTVGSLRNKNLPILKFKSKKDAEKENAYIMSRKDRVRSGKDGSIICIDIGENINSDLKIEGYLSITTYETYLFNSDDSFNRIRKNILEPFEYRLKNELLVWYVKCQYEKSQETHNNAATGKTG